LIYFEIKLFSQSKIQYEAKKDLGLQKTNSETVHKIK